MAGNDQLIDLKLNRRPRVRSQEVRKGRKDFVQVALAPFRCRQVLDAVVPGKMRVVDGIFETEEWRDKHHILAATANLVAYPRTVVAEQKFVISDVESMQPEHDVQHISRHAVVRRKIDRRRLDAVRGAL